MSARQFKHIVEIGAGDSWVSQGGPFHVYAERVSLYEPNPLLYADLKRAAEGVSNIRTYPCAVSSRSGSRLFYHFGYASFLEGARSFLALAEPEGVDPVFWKPLARPVEVVSMAEIDTGDIDFLVLTPNGCELEILPQMKSRPQVIRFKIYMHNATQVVHAQEICSVLESLGYTRLVSLETNEFNTYYHMEARRG